ncbi:hypothetical protein ACG7TL_006734 [Trametes sanguinea]
MDSMRTGRPITCELEDSAIWCERMCAVDAKAEAEEEKEAETIGRWLDADADAPNMDITGWAGDSARVGWRGKAHE